MVTRITLTIKQEIVSQARKYCLKNDLALSRFVARAIKNELEAREAGAVLPGKKTSPKKTT